MILDNKSQFKGQNYNAVSQFIIDNTKDGELDIVTGFFSIEGLNFLYQKLQSVQKFRLILANLMKEDAKIDKIINLLSGEIDVLSALSLSSSAQNAVAFLEQNKVEVKRIDKNFCHAKLYLYKDDDKRHSYFIVGSSNLTGAGLGTTESSNIELNIGKHDYESEFDNLKQWFEQKWKEASDKIKLNDGTQIKVKEYIIEVIKNLYKQYTPLELYYKTLYEMFKNEINELSINPEFKREIAHLEDTIIYKTLFPYQQKGVISLIKMLQKYNGAILADAVGLGKTWTALAVMKYFQLKGYTVLLLCPKKLANNWQQYKIGNKSRFEKDELEYFVRFHTDLQEGRFDRYGDHTLRYFKTRPKLLVVIDESHNLRNDKSIRYKFLVKEILMPENKTREVKVLQLSATPINNKLIDIRNQFKLMTKGLDDGFKNTELDIGSLEAIFRIAQQEFNQWAKLKNKTIADFIAKLPKKFEKLTDTLIVARTRQMIQNEFGEMNFPKKQAPINEFVTPEHIGTLNSFNDILDAIKINLTAYRPADYIKNLKPKSILEDEQQRQKFLVKMMYILLIKRLESSWFSFKITVENILKHHINALDKVNRFIQTKIDASIEEEFSEEEIEQIEDTASEIDGPDEEEEHFMLGKKNPIHLSEITDISLFKTHLEKDIEKLQSLKANLDAYLADFEAGKVNDPKLDRLIWHIQNKPKESQNKKVLIFTAYTDTAKFLYQQLTKRGIKNTAFVSGSISQTYDNYIGSKFEPILERFAPYTKLYKEKDWSELYEKIQLPDEYKTTTGKWEVSYEQWLEIIEKHDKETYEKIQNPIDVLVATDCLSEGQNLQDCDMVINYDIHWNPVRLIQRIGRIDRIGSPNSTIWGINFWPGKNYEDYLQLKKRVEDRMAAMTTVGTEVETITPELQKIIEENPLVTRQTQKMLEQLQATWEDVETSEESLGLNDFSLEQFRQELFDYFKKNEEIFKKMPNGIFTGFKLLSNTRWANLTQDSIVAVLGYPKRPEGETEHTYQEIYLLHQTIEGTPNAPTFLNDHEILHLLRHHKSQLRYVPADIEKGDKQLLEKLKNAILCCLKNQVAPTAAEQLGEMFKGTISIKNLPNQKLEEKFSPEQLDLINWFYISAK